jgi:hypothetical protein
MVEPQAQVIRLVLESRSYRTKLISPNENAITLDPI